MVKFGRCPTYVLRMKQRGVDWPAGLFGLLLFVSCRSPLLVTVNVADVLRK